MTEKVSLWTRNEKKLKRTMVCDSEKTESASTQTQTQKLSVRSRRAAVGWVWHLEKEQTKTHIYLAWSRSAVNARRKKARKTSQHLNFCCLPHRHPPSSPFHVWMHNTPHNLRRATGRLIHHSVYARSGAIKEKPWSGAGFRLSGWKGAESCSLTERRLNVL